METIHFLHIGKTGGTALVHALNEYKFCVNSPRRQHSSPYTLNTPSANNHLQICVHPHNEDLRNAPEGERVFFFLRDPIGRFISGFNSRRRRGQPRYNSPWSQAEAIAYGNFDTPDQLASALFSDDAKARSLAMNAMRSIQHIGQSYWSWFGNEEYLKSRIADILFVGFQETLEEDFERLKSTLKLPREMRLPTDDFNAFRGSPDADRTLSEKSIRNLRKWYSEDYELISICQEMFKQQR